MTKLLAALLLTLAVGVQVLEASGRWDATWSDANDEAAIVTVVLCVGVAIATAAARLHARPRPAPFRTVVSRPLVRRQRGADPTRSQIRSDSPPTTLRV